LKRLARFLAWGGRNRRTKGGEGRSQVPGPKMISSFRKRVGELVEGTVLEEHEGSSIFASGSAKNAEGQERKGYAHTGEDGERFCLNSQTFASRGGSRSRGRKDETNFKTEGKLWEGLKTPPGRVDFEGYLLEQRKQENGVVV